MNPQARPHYDRGMALLREGKPLEAKPHIKAALELDPQNQGLVMVYFVTLHIETLGLELAHD